MRRGHRRWPPSLAIALLFLLLAPAGSGAAGGALLVPPAGAGDLPTPPWHVVGLPQQSKPYTRFSAVTLDGQRVLKVEADRSYGNLVHAVHEEPAGRHRLSWRWRVDEPIAASDLRRKDGDDSPVKVCAMFDLATDAVPFVERQVLRVARLRSGEMLPSASVCYVWDAHLSPGTVLANAFTRRIRFIVLRGPETPLHSWVSEQRDVWADFLKMFGDEAEAVPPLVGIGIGADADNTQSRSLAYIGTITLE
ncbi:MAG: DUF3047 domain-containing protein [Burkholderiaceae bacterium]|nr:DUF3047 domain-containing protein [Burkholderiaceae bacterium]